MKLVSPLGCLTTFLSLVVFLGVVYWLALTFFGPSLIRRNIESETGFPTTLESAELKPLRGQVSLQGLHLSNPEGYPDERFLKVEGIHLEFRLREIRKEPFTLRRLELTIPELVVVRRADGSTNIDELLANLAEEEIEEEEDMPEFFLHHLILRFGTLVIVDGRNPDNVRVREYNFNIEREWEEVSELSKIIKPLLRDATDAGLKIALDKLLDEWIPILEADTFDGLLGDLGNFLGGEGRDLLEGTGDAFRNLRERLPGMSD
ncbi:MAG: hypothetical protein JJT75_00685 [Opitutales bacterium]|nr:hypothetical protein [Opitutales bacterium]MCH8541120.1 hypothetical protein [Opitutales bacterium]